MKKLKTPLDVKRRHFLKTVASSGISVAALKASTLGMSLMASRAFAEGANGIKHVVFVYVPDGAPPGTYTYNDGVLGPTAAPLEEVKDNIILFDGCTSNVGGHGNTDLLLGGGPTLDIQLEETQVGALTPVPSIHLGVETYTGQGFLSKRGTAVTYNDNPVNAFNKLFGGEVDNSPVGSLRFESVLDQNRAELAAIKAKLGNAEKERLEMHEASIERVESNFHSSLVVPPGCESPMQDASDLSLAASGEFTKVATLHAETIALALKCGLTNIACFQLGTHQAEHAIGTGELSYTKDYHQSIHGGGLAAYTECRSYLTERFAYLLKTLRDTTDGEGNSILDSTIVLQVTDMGNGDAHGNSDCPFTVAGASSKMNTGRTLGGADNNSLLNTVSEALGVTGDVTSYGNGSTVPGLLFT